MSKKPIIINAPASKSLSHRTLIAAALANGLSRISSALDSDDITRTRDCLTNCGADIKEENGDLIVRGMTDGPRGGNADGKNKDEAPHELFMHESGTTCRLMTAVAAAGHGSFNVHGAPRMHERPMGELTRALEKLGSTFDYQGEKGHLPFIMTSKGYTGKSVNITLEESSQYLSGLLLGAPLADHSVTINVTGEKAVSWPYVALTLRIMEDFKASFVVESKKSGSWKEVPWRSLKTARPGQTRFIVEPSGYQATDYRVEGDWSNASYFMAAGAVGKRPVLLKGLAADSLQGDRAIMDILSQMGASIQVTFDGILVEPANLRGVTVDMGRCPDLVPTVSAAAAFASSPTVIENVAHLRIKETDRLAACAEEASKSGAETDITGDSLIIRPGRLRKGETIDFTTYGDHRMAMSMSLFQLANIDTQFDNPACVGKSFPGFWDEWAKITG
ncbi:3-phosphoshikimate 1-carboxyvinyltransferase [Pseudodesulfovibrio profundus]|uniref:3-phosphoshikimate 1-carboxyvinyltransferase n=1 Tax=Pseudodesulfovibrio profundus TaxID=57320 RepID=A0A2C8FBE7_9BACT|nr:3-phosphoshikimate 1-carboxyvinyltransferase [Pseudodesulfovibrio profundus]MBC15659.1 3-phosphoshikimate 1-carboxyvinyltransferase [Desulfovibrio sp.]SOB59757.1 3-phosphoshikimate 1-carboxyvinyltransferase [Pseudodesulfovibrio profundus]|tara:strand:- start:4033 stop:5373 length:1341 start_codon:yes stop_codon:yes gene_type:complete